MGREWFHGGIGARPAVLYGRLGTARRLVGGFGHPVPSLAVPPPASAALALFPRELLSNLTLRDLRGKYKRSTLGYLWSVINPAVNLAIYTIVFGVFLKVQPPVGDPSGLEMYGFFLVAALLPWTFVTASLGGAVGAMVGNEGLIKKVYFPRWVLPASVILSCLIGFLVELAVLSVAFAFVGNGVIEYLPAILALVLLELGFVVGLGLALSVANVYFRDIQHFLGIVLNVWFYATPILYPVTQVPEKTEIFGRELPVRAVVEANPMAVFAEAFRDAFYDLRAPSLGTYSTLALWTAASLLFGTLVFRRLEPRLAEEL